MHAGAPALPPLPLPNDADLLPEFRESMELFREREHRALETMREHRSVLALYGSEGQGQGEGGLLGEATMPTIDTCTWEVQLDMEDREDGNFLDIGIIGELLAMEDVVEYNERTIQRQPVLSTKNFGKNQPQLSLSQDKAQGSNAISIKLLATLKLHITGPKALDELQRLAEYGRGLVEVMKGGSRVRLSSFKCDLMNTTTRLGCRVRLPELDDYLRDEDDGRVMNVSYDTNKHAAVHYQLYVGDLVTDHKDHPKVQVFDSGCMIIAAKSYELLAEAYVHSTQTVSNFCSAGGGKPVRNETA